MRKSEGEGEEFTKSLSEAIQRRPKRGRRIKSVRHRCFCQFDHACTAPCTRYPQVLTRFSSDGSEPLSKDLIPGVPEVVQSAVCEQLAKVAAARIDGQHGAPSFRPCARALLASHLVASSEPSDEKRVRSWGFSCAWRCPCKHWSN